MNNTLEKIKFLEAATDDFANSYNSIDKIRSVYQNNNEYWNETSLDSGLPAFILFYSELNRINSTEKYDELIYRYMTELTKHLNKGITSMSIWNGITSAAIPLLSQKNKLVYAHFIDQINEFIINNVDNSLQTLFSNIHNKNVRMQDYDVISGISGIMRYLLEFKDNPKVDKVIKRILRYFIELSTIKKENGIEIPNWYISIENQFLDSDRALFKRGSFNLGLSHGIAGPMAAMALAVKYGYFSSEINQAISRIINWYSEWKVDLTNGGITWPRRISFEESGEKSLSKTNKVKRYESWCYGEPGIGRALWLGAASINDLKTKKIIEEMFKNYPNKTHDISLNNLAICHGFTGLLLILDRMYKDTALRNIGIARKNLIEYLIKCIEEDKFTNEREDLPKLLTGKMGVLLVVITLLRNENIYWDFSLLIN